MKTLRIICFLLHILLYCANAQEFEQEQLENLFENLATDTEKTPEFDFLEHLMLNPINLRTALPEDLMYLPGFNSFTAIQIINSAQSDSLPSIVQIARIFELSDEQSFILQTCFYTESKERMAKPAKLHYRARSKSQFNNVKGFENNSFRGSELDLYNKIAYSQEAFSFGLLADKDAGEHSLADYYSGYATFRSGGLSVIVGDYYVETGMGNILWKSFGLKKGAEVIAPVIQRGRGIVPWRSSLDYGFFRGGSMQYSSILSDNSSFKLLAFASSVKRSANLDTNLGEAIALYTAGYYRTDSELAKKNKLGEQSFGGALEYSYLGLTAGLSAISLNYDYSVNSSSSSVFSGKNGILSSGYIFLALPNIFAGGEISFDAKGNLALKTAAQFISGSFDGALAIRSFSKDYRSPFGYNFGEFSFPANEYGFYAGARWKPANNLVLSAYLDIFSSNGTTYFIPAAVKGSEFFIESRYRINKDTEPSIRFKFEDKTDAVKFAKDDFHTIYQRKKYLLRFDLRRNLTRTLSIRLRADGTYLDNSGILPNEIGSAGFAEFVYDESFNLKLGARLTIFSTDSYSTAIWQYEYSLPGIMLTPALYGEGAKAILWAKYRPAEFIDVWARFSYLTKNNVKSIGSGLTEILGSDDKRLHLQVDFRY